MSIVVPNLKTTTLSLPYISSLNKKIASNLILLLMQTESRRYPQSIQKERSPYNREALFISTKPIILEAEINTDGVQATNLIHTREFLLLAVE